MINACSCNPGCSPSSMSMLHIFGIHLVICGQCLAARLLVVSCETDFLFILVNGKEKKIENW
jgi:hypothetical protein